ncbi:ATP-binding cassette domain-containing protein [Gilvibacter sediminis]|uniref:ATP-binding cassette domain-containing protein n=1 Tax=Gilvibacter sediminis TaxID=379071 RepID=UPI0023500904|nr:ATP-binding cassette domain-containing protein [Gilvibacter sediminis]MDC7999012.1 ATP-binding cassette domain-containing protein [Gilvibacter sediminis]
MKLVGLNITKSYGANKILEDVSLQINAGGIFGLLGRNGCGKSTLLKILFGSLKADTGSFYLNQETYEPYHNFRQQKVAYLAQDGMYPRQLKVKDLIPMACPEGAVQDRIFYTPGIHELTKKWVSSLSEGQRTYLGVVLSCYMPHSVLLLDEPFSMTDPKTIEQIKILLEETAKHKAVLITDHYYHDVMELCSEIKVLQQGKLYETSTEEDLKRLGYIR